MLSRAIGAAMGCALWRTSVSAAGAACTMARTADPPDCSPASRRQVRLLAVQRGRTGDTGQGAAQRAASGGDLHSKGFGQALGKLVGGGSHVSAARPLPCKVFIRF